ncbi:ABC transporter ATP-binding protein [Rhizobiaceae bacterium BDR2-2]|uniref:ABC transporter ATP-binding protein n=1 Tax=Ectorhizobium quercum TaxID=2965071 RepID=A0AAE3MZT0_9HYPH|nr:ABC transporter ATP-binding protein [Ectorhizobium quercum]MCX8997476.1 ABC transporter ATP-binding protein [Ectorhizobium quercum]
MPRQVPPAPPSNYLSVQSVTKHFHVDGRQITALTNVDLNVERASFVTIVGASGCGKSTLLRIIAGLERSEGHVLHDGTQVSGPSLSRGLVFQEPRLFPWLDVEGNIALGLENSGLGNAEKRELVREHLALVSLSDFARAYPRQLSGGMAQRVAIARGLVNRPGLLLLDEPFGALDAFTRAHLQDELQRIWQKERITALLVTHDVDEAVLLGGRVVIMSPRPGRIAEIVDVPLPYPRDRRMPEIAPIRNTVLDILDGIRTPPGARTPLEAVA